MLMLQTSNDFGSLLALILGILVVSDRDLSLESLFPIVKFH